MQSFTQAMKKFVVIDIQGYFTNSFEVKELAIYDGKEMKSWIFKPKTPYQDLSESVKKQVKYIFYNIHGIHYNSGFTEYSQLNEIIRQELSNVHTVYVKGDSKSKLLEAICSQIEVKYPPPPSIINLERIANDVPNLYQSFARCIHHKLSLCSCSIQNAYLLYNYILNMLSE